jgi:NAD(P)H-hydrate epimerase
MSGAAVLTAQGAIRSGAGLVLLGVPRSSLDVVEGAVTEAVKLPLPDVEGQIDAKGLDELGDRIEKAHAIAIGPGIGRGTRAVALVRRVLDTPLPVVADADALTALADILHDEPDALRDRRAPTVVTPHAGEFARLAGERAGEDRLSAARHAAAQLGAVVHLKGRRAVTACPGGRAWINTTGNPGMATGGTGDVLTGIAGALCAQGMPASDAMWAAAWIHGRAGDLAGGRGGTISAGDVAAALPSAIERLRSASPRLTDGPIRSVLE